MCISFRWFCLILAIMFINTVNFAQPDETLPVEVKKQAGKIVFTAHPAINSFRMALYDMQGNLRGDSEALTSPSLQWIVPTHLQSGEYLGVLWLRGQSEVEKVLTRLEVRATAVSLQAAEVYLNEFEPSESVLASSSKYNAAERRAHKRGVAAIPFFRMVTKVMPDESIAHLLLARAILTKYPRAFISPDPPPPPPPPPPPIISSSRKRGSASRRKTEPAIVENIAPEPTPVEKQEMLAACQKAVAAAKTCAVKTHAMQWLATMQGNLDQREAQRSTLEQIAQASCATKEIKAQSWYAIGVNEWQCSYELTTRYADQTQVNDPFHYRNISKASDQQRAASCIENGMKALDQAIILMPDFGDAWAYRSLLYREKQKISSAESERQNLSQMAEEAAKRSIEITQNQRNIK